MSSLLKLQQKFPVYQREFQGYKRFFSQVVVILAAAFLFFAIISFLQSYQAQISIVIGEYSYYVLVELLSILFALVIFCACLYTLVPVIILLFALMASKSRFGRKVVCFLRRK